MNVATSILWHNVHRNQIDEGQRLLQPFYFGAKVVWNHVYSMDLRKYYYPSKLGTNHHDFALSTATACHKD